MSRKPKPKVDKIPPQRLRDVSVEVYKRRLGKNDTARLLAEKDGEATIRERAGQYDQLTRVYMSVLKVR